MAKCEEELKSLWTRLKKNCEKADIKVTIQKTTITACSLITSWWIEREKMETVTDSFLGLQNHGGGMKLKDTPWKKSTDKHRQLIKKQRHHFANKGLYNQSYGVSSSHVWMWELDHKDSWALKNWCFWTVVLEKTLESSLDHKDIWSPNQSIQKEIDPEYSWGELMLKLKLQYFGHPMWSWLIWKDPDTGTDWW